MKRWGNNKQSWALAGVGIAVAGCLGFCIHLGMEWLELKSQPAITKTQLQALTTESLRDTGTLPQELRWLRNDRLEAGILESTLRSDLNARVARWLETYKPDVAAVVVMNANTGAILSARSFEKFPDENSFHPVFHNGFPAASIFKLITAETVLSEGKIGARSTIAFNGSNHSLYRRNVKAHTENRWTRRMSLAEAFGKSVNTVFGKLGVFHTDATKLMQHAKKLGFNKSWNSDLHIPTSTLLEPKDPWNMAETASGFNRSTTLSPIHGAWLGAVVVNGGVAVTPHVVKEIRDSTTNEVLYVGPPSLASAEPLFSPSVHQELLALMQETVWNGTSRKAFRSLLRSPAGREIELGGKTGSLTGNNPAGKTDWFVGYAGSGDQQYSIAVVTVHRKFWTVKSSVLARLIVEDMRRLKFFE